MCVCDYCVKAMTKAMHSCLARFCKNYVGASVFRFLRCLISRSASSSSSDWSAASCPRRDNLLSVRVHVYLALCVLSHVIVSEDGSCPRCGPDDNETAGRDYLGHPDGGCLVL